MPTVTVEAPIPITKFEGHFIAQLPDTYSLLRRAQLMVDPGVARVILSGSRGLAGKYRPDSDVDLALIVHASRLPDEPGRAPFLRRLLETTLHAWAAPVGVDLAAVFDVRGCDLRCLDRAYADPRPCPWDGGRDCFGIYKVQRGFDGYITHGVEVKRIYPCIRIWRNRTYPIGGT